MTARTALCFLTATLTATAIGCSGDDISDGQVDNLTSTAAQFLELDFSGSVVAEPTDDDSEIHRKVEAQLFYLAGELDKVHSAHGQFGFVELSDVSVEEVDGGLERISYRAKLPVQWPKNRTAPETYRVVVPNRVDSSGLRSFNSKYKERGCAKAKYGVDTLWYDFKPVTSGCELDAEDVLDVEANVSPSPHTTIDRYPEMNRFWEDGEMRIVLVHGTDSASSKDESDGLVRQYVNFQKKLIDDYDGATITTGDTNYNVYEDWQLETRIPAYGGGEGKLIVNTLLTSSIKYISDSSEFDERFDELSKDADIIIYGGHSGLSKNIKALARKGVVKPNHYQVFFLQGCSTFAYLDRSIVDRRIEVNGADNDPEGTKHLDLIVTGQPAYFFTNVPSFSTVVSKLTDSEAHSYLDILGAMPQSAIPIVAGEEDNPNTPPAAGGGTDPGDGDGKGGGK